MKKSKIKWHQVVRVYWDDKDQRHREAFVFKSLSLSSCYYVADLLSRLNESGDSYQVALD